MNIHYYYGYCQRHLWIINWIIIFLNAISFMVSSFLFYLSFFIKIGSNNINSYRNLIFHISILFLIINIIFLLGNYLYSRHDYINDEYSLLVRMYMCLGIGYVILFITSLNASIYNPVSYFISLLLIIGSIGLMYYIKYPVYLSKNLSLGNIMRALDIPIQFFFFILYLLELIFFIVLVILRFIISMINHVKSYDISKSIYGSYNHYPYILWIIKKNTIYTSSSRYNEKKIIHYYIIRHLLNHYYFPNHNIKVISKSRMDVLHQNLYNSLYLKQFEHVFNDTCYHVFTITFLGLTLLFFIIVLLTLIYSNVNNINIFTVIHFLFKVFLCVLEFILWTVPTIFAADGFLLYLERHPEFININVAEGILLFIPFVEILYVMKVFNKIVEINN